MSDLPDPLTPPDCDLRGYGYMPLHGHHLFGSEFWAESSDEERVAALGLWWSSWLQCPAASLPTGDKALAGMAGYGRDIKGWLKVKDRVLHGFILCSDGRIYHRFLSSQAVAAYEQRLKSDTKREADRERLRLWREAKKAGASKPEPEDDGCYGGDDNETASETGVKRVSSDDDTYAETHVVAGGKEKKLLDKEVSKKTPALRAAPLAARGSRLETDWTPGDEGWHFASDLGLDPNAVLGKFRDHWAAQAGAKGVKLDWQATWRNWCRTDAERRKGRPGSGRSADDVFGVGRNDLSKSSNLMLGIPL